MRKRVVWALFALAIILISSAVVFKENLLRQCSVFLIREDQPQPSDAIIVLSGGGYDRGNKANQLYQAGFAPVVICTGANPIYDIRSFGLDTLESHASAANLLRLGVPDSSIQILTAGTSTVEEADTLKHFLSMNGYKNVLIVTSRLHTRRVKKVLAQKWKDTPVKYRVCGAPSSRFDELNWWKSEDGLIALNNEWLKTVYYLLKY